MIADRVTLKEFCKAKGYNIHTVRGYIKSGIWQRGIHYRKPAGLILIDLKEVKSWEEAEEESQKRAKRVYASRSRIKGNAVARRSSLSPQLRI